MEDVRHAKKSSGIAWLLAFLVAVLANPLGCDGGDDEPPSSLAERAVIEGRVEGSGPVENASVYLIDAEAAGARATSLSPLEDLAGDSPFQAVTDRDGRFRIEAEPGRWFVIVVPHAGDTRHLPGGSLSRRSIVVEDKSLTVLAILLSERPPDDATFVGSSVCLGCHPSHASVRETLHSVALRKLDANGSVLSPLQDLSRFPDANAALEYFADGNPNDNTGPGDGYGLRVTSVDGWSVLLGVDANGHFQAIETADRNLISERLYAVLTYGGAGRWATDFLTRLDASGAYTDDAVSGSYHVLPARFVETRVGSIWGIEREPPRWQIRSEDLWSPPATQGAPPASFPQAHRSFDNDCAGCHLTGFELETIGASRVRARAVSDPGGVLDYDGDGELDEISIGCEACHGPGSEHAATARGSIVQPDLLSPGRAHLICGRCHVRGTGNGGIASVPPGSFASRNDAGGSALLVPRPGLSPAEFLGVASGSEPLPSFGTEGGFLDPADLASDPHASWRDGSGGFGSRNDHSRAGMQTWMDHARSAHAQNPFELVTCHDCHSPHERAHDKQLLRPAADNTLCLDCHAGFGDFSVVAPEDVERLANGGSAAGVIARAIDAHVRDRTFELFGVAMNLGEGVYANPAGGHALGRCTVCHMPQTASAGAFVRDADGRLIRGDNAGHTFEVISPETRRAMAESGVEPVPGSCVLCHQGPPNGAWPDWRFAPGDD